MYLYRITQSLKFCYRVFSQYQGLHNAAMKREVNKGAAGFFMEKLNILHNIPAPPKSMHYIWGCRIHRVHWKLLLLLLLGVIILTLSDLWSHLLLIKSHEFFWKELLFTNCTKSYRVVFIFHLHCYYGCSIDAAFS